MARKSNNEFKNKHFRGEIILWAVRWYSMFAISYWAFWNQAESLILKTYRIKIS